MAETSKNKIYYNDNEDSIADVLTDMKELAESVDEAIENVKYDDKQIKQNISNIEEKNTAQDKNITNNTKSIEELKTENETLKAENKLIKEQIPSASASGNSVHIEDSGTLDFDWKINGGHKQATREGYNLIDIQNNNRIFMNLASDIKHENYENGILFNYDYDSDYAYHNAYRFAFIYYPFKKNKQYRLSWKTQNLGEIPQSLQYYFPEFEQYLTLNNAFTPQNDTNWIAIFVKNDDFVEGCKVAITDVMLTEGSEIKPYEQYGVSPSPDYPSEIETVGSNINYFDENTVESKFLNSKTGQTSDNASWRCTDFIEILSKQYNFSWESDSEYFQATVCYYDKNKTFIYGNEYGLFKIYSKTFEIPDGANYMKVAYSIIVNGKPVTRDKIKLEIGNKRTLYSPFMCGSVEIDVVNKNFINKNKISKGLMITATGETTNSKYFSTDYIKVSKNETYYANEYVPVVAAYDKDKKSIGYIRNTLTGGSFNTGNAVYIRARNSVQLSTEEEIQNAIDKAMIIKGSTSSDYTEHQSQSAIMPIQQEMLEGDYVADVEHHEWEKIIIDTSKLIEDVTNEEGKKRYRYGYDKNIKRSDATHNVAYSNMFKLLGDGQTFFNVKGFTITNNNIYIYDEGESLTEFKSKITDKQLVFYAQLETSINLELTEEQKAIRDTKLYTYKNITNIAVSDELASIDVEYKKNPATEHDELQNQIDEIKQLISTTQTSALLLYNLQKDVESEVE